MMIHQFDSFPFVTTYLQPLQIPPLLTFPGACRPGGPHHRVRLVGANRQWTTCISAIFRYRKLKVFQYVIVMVSLYLLMCFMCF